MTNVITLSNYITYEANKHASGSEIRGTYTGSSICVKLSGSDGKVNIIVDGVYHSELIMKGQYRILDFGSEASRYIQIVQENIETSAYSANHLLGLFVERSKWVSDYESTVSNRIIELSDSIGQGQGCTNNVWDTHGMLLRRNDSMNTIIGGFGGAKLEDFASNSTKIDTTVGWLTSGFSNVTGDKKVLLNIGTNDYGAGTSAANVRTWLDNLLDAINTEDSAIHIYVLSPFNRTGETSLLADIRTEQSGSCSARAFATYMEGDGLINPATQTVDGLHPSTAGQLSIYNSIKSTLINPLS